jgi:hypothetical protein
MLHSTKRSKINITLWSTGHIFKFPALAQPIILTRTNLELQTTVFHTLLCKSADHSRSSLRKPMHALACFVADRQQNPQGLFIFLSHVHQTSLSFYTACLRASNYAPMLWFCGAVIRMFNIHPADHPNISQFIQSTFHVEKLLLPKNVICYYRHYRIVWEHCTESISLYRFPWCYLMLLSSWFVTNPRNELCVCMKLSVRSSMLKRPCAPRYLAWAIYTF